MIVVAVWMSTMNAADVIVVAGQKLLMNVAVVIVVAVWKTLVIVSLVAVVVMEVDVVGDFVQGLLENNRSIS